MDLTPAQQHAHRSATDAYWAHLFTEGVMLTHEQRTSPTRLVAIEKTCARHTVWRGGHNCVDQVRECKDLLAKRLNK